jgi:hypothetical protein
MKKIAGILMILLLLIASCSNKNDEGESKDRIYRGTVSVNQNEVLYEQENVKVVFTLENGSVDIKMYQVSFSERMPVKLDMTISGVAATEKSGEYIITGDNIIPMAYGSEFPNYIITDMEGKFTDNAASFDMLCGVYPTSFRGTKAQE